MNNFVNLKKIFGDSMNIKVIIHKEDGGYWGEVLSIPGCVSQGDTFEELIENLNEAIEGCLSIED